MTLQWMVGNVGRVLSVQAQRRASRVRRPDGVMMDVSRLTTSGFAVRHYYTSSLQVQQVSQEDWFA